MLPFVGDGRGVLHTVQNPFTMTLASVAVAALAHRTGGTTETSVSQEEEVEHDSPISHVLISQQLVITLMRESTRPVWSSAPAVGAGPSQICVR